MVPIPNARGAAFDLFPSGPSSVCLPVPVWVVVLYGKKILFFPSALVAAPQPPLLQGNVLFIASAYCAVWWTAESVD